jgi:hypothetical protein
VAVPILVAQKIEGGLRSGVDYCALKKAMVKNGYPLPLISGMLGCVRKARIFKELNLCGAYNLVRIKEGDEYKKAFQTGYSQLE